MFRLKSKCPHTGVPLYMSWLVLHLEAAVLLLDLAHTALPCISTPGTKQPVIQQAASNNSETPYMEVSF